MATPCCGVPGREKVSGSLPVYVSPDDVNKHPLLSHLLEDLSHRLSPAGVHKTSHTHLTQATQAMMHTRQKYLEGATLHRLTTDVLLGSPGDNTDQKVRREVLEALTLSEVQDHLALVGGGPRENTPAITHHQDPLVLADGGSEKDTEANTQHQYPAPPSRKVAVFGLSREELVVSLHEKVGEDWGRRLAAGLEVRLEKEWTKIASFIDPIGFISYDLEEVVAMVESLETTSQKLTKEKSQLIHSTIQTDCLSELVYRQLVEYSKVLHSLAKKHRLSRYITQHLASSFVKLSGHVLKLRCLQLEVLVATYTAQSVPVLKGLETHLAQRGQVAQQNLTRLNHALVSYSGLDPRFQHLLREYAKLQEDIAFVRSSTQEYSV